MTKQFNEEQAAFDGIGTPVPSDVPPKPKRRRKKTKPDESRHHFIVDRLKVSYGVMNLQSGEIVDGTIRGTPLEAAAAYHRHNPPVSSFEAHYQIVSIKLGWNISDTVELPI